MTTSMLSVLHVVVRVGATNSQYNEHCLPMIGERRITVCSLFPTDLTPPAAMRLVEGDGTRRGCYRALVRALDLGPYDIVHVHAASSGVLTLAAYFLTRRSRRNLVFTVHNSWPNFKLRNRLFLYWILALFPVVVTCGYSARDSMPRLLKALFGSRISVVQNGVDLDRIDRCAPPETEAPRSRQGTEVVSVNRLIRLKDPATLLDAFVRASHYGDRLVLVGDGALRPRVVEALTHAGLTNRVSLTGVVERNEVYRILSHADYFVSAWRGEGLAGAVLLTMACRCPVVLSDIAPHREIAKLAPGITLFEPGDVAELARLIGRMRDLDPDTRHDLGEQARRCVEQHFSVRSMNEKYGRIYQALAARNAATGRRAHKAQPAPPPDDAEVSLPTRMRRHWPLVAALVLFGTTGGFVYSQVRAPEYQAKSSLVVGEVFGGAPTDDTVKASAALAASYADLARREPVLGPVAEAEGLGDWRLLQDQVHSQPGDKNPLLVQIQVTAGAPEQAEQIAEAVSQRLVDMTANATKGAATDFAEREIARLEDDIRQTEDRIDNLHKRLNATSSASTADALEADLQNLRKVLVDLQTSHQALLDRFVTAGAAGEIRIVEHAYATPSPLRPDPIALSAAGFAAGLALAAAWLQLGVGAPRPRPGPQTDLPTLVLGDVRPMWAEQIRAEQNRPDPVRTEQRGPDGHPEERQPREGGRR